MPARAAQLQRDAVRKPPRPPYQGQPGRCCFCGGRPEGKRRTWCSDACVAAWAWASRGGSAAWHLLDLLGHTCWECGEQWQPGDGWMHREQPNRTDGWRPTLGPPTPQQVELQVDHVRPLWSLTDTERTELRWWLPFNLQMLCKACHDAKTKAEAAQRARLRRGEPGQVGSPGQQQAML